MKIDVAIVLIEDSKCVNVPFEKVEMGQIASVLRMNDIYTLFGKEV